MSRDARNPVFGVSDQVNHKSACIIPEKGLKFETLDLSKKTKAMLSCAVAAPLFSLRQKSDFSHDAAHISMLKY